MEQPGYIYAIGAENGFVKIGYTTNLAGRLSHLRANNCMALTGLGYVPASKDHEAELHGLLASERERNEWYRRGRIVEHFISQLVSWPDSDGFNGRYRGKETLHGVRITEIADRVGITYQGVREWSRSRVPAERVLKVSKITGVPPHEIRPDLYPVQMKPPPRSPS